jgi:hypothetical protein
MCPRWRVSGVVICGLKRGMVSMEARAKMIYVILRRVCSVVGYGKVPDEAARLARVAGKSNVPRYREVSG